MAPVELPDPHAHPDAAEVVTRAVCRAADRLGLGRAALAEVLGIDASQASRLYAGARLLRPSARAVWERALLFLRLYRSLDATWSGSDEASRAWLHTRNHALGGTPAERIGSAEGMVRVLGYLDAMRAGV